MSPRPIYWHHQIDASYAKCICDDQAGKPLCLYRLREASGLLMIVASLIAFQDPSDKRTIEGDIECGSGN